MRITGLYEGEETAMACEPDTPRRHPGVAAVSQEEVERRGTDAIVFSTACWRRYIGTWEIKDGRFYLVDIRGAFRKIAEGPIFADWFPVNVRYAYGLFVMLEMEIIPPQIADAP